MIESSELKVIAFKGFAVGDKVTVKSIRAKSMLLGVPTTLELANYPSLVGVELTIESFDEPWVICTRTSGKYASGLTVDDIELLGGQS